MKNQRLTNTIKILIFFIASLWFVAYCSTTDRPNPLTLCLGIFVIIPITFLQASWYFARSMSTIGGRLLLSKQYGLAHRCAIYGTGICQWWASIYKLGGSDSQAISRLLLNNLLVLADSAYMTQKIDEAIAVRQQMVEVAAEAGYDCDAAKACDFLAFFFRKKKDRIHARHWAERSLAYYAKLSAETCSCRKGHDHLTGQHAALHALLAIDSQAEGFRNAAEIAARRAEDLLSNCDPKKCEVALIRLMNFYYYEKNWEKFEPLTERYLNGHWAQDFNSSKYMAGLTHMRLGEMHAGAGDFEKAEQSYTSALTIACEAERSDLVKKIETAQAAMRAQKDESCLNSEK